MKFNYETLGPATYLVCELEPNESVDTLTLGMITNNHIVGLAPVLYTELNGQKFLKYNVSAKITADNFFVGEVAKEKVLDAFTNIANSLCTADDYMIDQSCFALEPEHVYLNVSSYEVSLICIPIQRNANANLLIIDLFKTLLNKSGSEGEIRFPKLSSYLSNEASFNIYGFLGAIQEEKNSSFQSQTAVPVPQISVNGPAVPSPNPLSPVINGGVSNNSINSVSGFDATISIKDAPGMLGVDLSAANKPNNERNSWGTQEHNSAGSMPVNQSPQIPQKSMPSGNGGTKGHTVGFASNKNNHGVQNGINKLNSQPSFNPVEEKKAFAIPGKNNVHAAKSSSVNIPSIPGKAPMGTANPGTPNGSAPADGGEKKMTFLGLLSHYSKENHELYKAQKASAKTNKESKKKSKGTNSPVPNIPGAIPSGMQGRTPGGMPGGMSGGMPGGMSGGMPGGMSGGMPAGMSGGMPAGMPGGMSGGIPGGMPAGMSGGMPYASVQNQFNSTTVLDNSIGETTVLSAVVPKPGEPFLIRTKNQEQIIINKPVFRIGKEKSYVDYFISDNTAISRSHANIISEQGEFFVEDMNSTNHTFVNGAMITGNQKVKINEGDKIRLANEEFTFHC